MDFGFIFLEGSQSNNQPLPLRLPSVQPSHSPMPPTTSRHFNFTYYNYQCVIKSLAGSQSQSSPSPSPLPLPPFVPPGIHFNFVHCNYRYIIKSLAGAQPLPSTPAQPLPPTPIVPSGSQPPVVDHPKSGPSETDGRQLISLIYSDGRPMKFEPQDVTRSITKALHQYLPGPIAQWKEYPREASYHFATEREVANARISWDKIAANRFIDYLNKYKEKEKGGPVSYKELFEHTHRRKNTGDFVSPKAKEVMTYVEQMVDKHGDDSAHHPEFDPTAWLAAIGQPKKGRVFKFGSGLDAGGVISSSQDSHGSTTAVTPSHTLPSDQVREAPHYLDHAIEAREAERDDDEDEDLRIHDD
ncbi:hypothetical protein Taro_014876 [Colocasia esculenta]|uniref:Uncharacterized protein n=1 Tax=Colocasia esculenta TaxID=4460 RepID=A0A843UKP1_COLES|nr:hypothetical protein [Colocasia esculenta]